MESSLVSSHQESKSKQQLVTPGRVKLMVTPRVTMESSLELKKRDPEDGQSSQPRQAGEPVGLSWTLCPETAEQQSCTAGSTRTLSKGTVIFSLSEDPAIRKRWEESWEKVPSEAQVPFTASEEKVIKFWCRWGHRNRIPYHQWERDCYEFFKWAKFHRFFTNVVYSLDFDLWELMDAAFHWALGQGVGYPEVFLVHIYIYLFNLKTLHNARDILAQARSRLLSPPASARKKPLKEDEPRVCCPPAQPTAEQKFFSAPSEQTDLPSPPAPSLGGDGEPSPPLSGPAPPAPPRNSPLPPPREGADPAPPQPAPREAPDPAAPPQPAPREAPDPAAPPQPAPREAPEPEAPPQPAPREAPEPEAPPQPPEPAPPALMTAPAPRHPEPPPADPPVLPGSAINNSDSPAVLLSPGAAGAASVSSSFSASQPATEFATVQAAPARADPAPSPPPPPVPPLPADPIAVQELAENGAEPTGSPQEPTPAPVLPAPPTPVVPQVFEAPSFASDPAKSLSFRGGGVALQLTAGAVRLAVFKIILCFRILQACFRTKGDFQRCPRRTSSVHGLCPEIQLFGLETMNFLCMFFAFSYILRLL
ncbi:uncharacterized protein LOC135288694 [Passer domesticus]|uniref:uncharacterized protein LOC135288694 n=1 Tax=Passer domesticus TaxID=48849 RepID=UPI0030FE3913